MIGYRTFDRTLTYVRRTDLPAQLEALLRPDGKGGRPRALGLDVLLAAMMLTYELTGTLHLTAVHNTLTHELSREVQVRHGIRPSLQGEPISVRQVRYPWSAAVARLTATATLQDAIDRLTGAASTHLPVPAAYAVDLTAVDCAAKARGRMRKGEKLPKGGRPKRSADPDARYGYRTRTYQNGSKSFFGYQLGALVRVGPVDGVEEPLLIDKVTVVPGNEKAIAETFALLDRLAAAGQMPTELLADRGFTFAKVQDWARPLADRGIRQVMDIHPADHGPRLDVKTGYVMIDGWPHCPGTPTDLHTVKRPPRLSVGPQPTRKGRSDAQYAEDLRTWQAGKDAIDRAKDMIAERARYRFEKHGTPKTGKKGKTSQRFICPARAGKILCEGCPLFAGGLPAGTGLPTVQAETPLPKACSQATITIADIHGQKLRQQDYWLSPEWIASYARRSRVEARFGIHKGIDTGGIRRGWTHQVGQPKTSLLLAIAVAATNLNQLLIWAKNTGNTADPLTQMDVTDYGFAEYDADGTIAGGVSPPAVA